MAIDNRDDSRLKYITEFFTDLIRNWYVFAITLLVICGGTLVYIKFAAKTYKVEASVLLNIERSNAYGGRNDDILKMYELIEKDKNLQNEIYYMKSTPLVRSVVEDMDLLVSYYLQKDKIPKEASFSLKDLYKDSPFIVLLNKNHLQPAETFFYIQILDEENFLISADNSKSTIINYSDVARTLGVSQPTAREYFNIAHGTFIWRHILPYEKNATKRIIKHPKGYLRDSGLLHALLHLNNRDSILAHPQMGHSWESMAVENLLRGFNAQGITYNYYHYRTGGGAEVDLILEGEFGLLPIEIKYGQKVPLKQLRGIRDFIQERGCRYGIVINNAERAIQYDDKLIGIPFGCL